MSSLAVYRELKGVQEHLLTRKEYAVLVRAASQKVIKQYIRDLKQAEAELAAWCDANPEPDRKKFGYSQVNGWPSNAAYERWNDVYETHRGQWGHRYQGVYQLARYVRQLKDNIILSRMIEDGRYETARLERNFFVNFGGVNNPLLNHGQAVFRAIYAKLDVPEAVLAEWPEGVEQVRKDMAAQERWNQLNPEYA
jgi:hypothetical protein